MAMAEINEAARIITEHIDPDAKVIFGAVIDDKLKKGEIKITVVATGFSNLGVSPRPAGYDAGPSLFETIKKQQNQIYADGPRNSQPQVQDPAPVKEFVDASVEEEQFDIPAFIRRKMKN